MKPIRERPHRLEPSRFRGERTAAFTACVCDRREAFTSKEVVEHLIGYLAKAAQAHACFVPVYCFMPDHLHVMFKGVSGESDLLEAMCQFKHRSGLWMARARMPFRWQKDFHDHVVRNSEDWRAHATYIALNPARAGIVDDLFEYPFTGSIGTDLSDVVLGWA